MSEDGIVKWGLLTDVEIRLQFPNSKFDRLSFATTPIEIYGDEKRLGHASGFFWRRSSEVWLITNWHCLTGNNPITRRALQPNISPPSKIVFYPLTMNTSDDGSHHCPERSRVEQALFRDCIPAWRQHRKFEKLRIDIVAVRVELKEMPFSGDAIICANEFAPVELFHHVGADLFVVGYPLNNFDGWMPPFWKRGSFAGEPVLPMGDKPLFPIDVLSTEGMSGSPVFRRVFGPKATSDAKYIQMDNIVATEFVGVYAGRLASKDLDRVGIGYGWYGYLVDVILSDGAQGSTC